MVRRRDVKHHMPYAVTGKARQTSRRPAARIGMPRAVSGAAGEGTERIVRAQRCGRGMKRCTEGSTMLPRSRMVV